MMSNKIIKFSPDECDRDGFISVAQVAAKVSLSQATVYNAIASGELIAYKFMGKKCIRPADVERWVLIKAVKITGVAKNARMQKTARISA